MFRLGWMLVVPSTLAALAYPRFAEACQPDPCWSVDQFRTFSSTQATVAIDGVIAFEYERSINMLEEAQALEYVDVVVGDDMGNAIPGALEAWGASGVAVWRPSMPLPPNTSLQVTIVVDNASIAAATTPRWADCNPDIAFDLPIETASDALPEIVADGITPTSEVVLEPIVWELTELVCCDGAFPTLDELACGEFGPQWSEGHCATTAGEARLDAGFDFATLLAMDTHEDLLPIMVGGVGWTVRPSIDATRVSTWDVEPFCAHIDVWSLARGTRVSTDEVCFGDDIADQLGPTTLDPSAELDAQCVGEPYTCTAASDGFGQSWDMRDCQPWPDGASDTTSTADSGGDDDAEGEGEAGSVDGGSADGGTDSAGDDTTPSTASASDDGESSGSGAQDGVADRGCACASDPRSSDAGAFGLLVLVALRRRRADHSATRTASGS